MTVWLRSTAWLLPLLLCACIERDLRPNETPVLARVNGGEITQHQFDRALERTGFTAPGTAVREEIADKLIDRELALQQALELKLERRPDIMLRLEEARRDILAAAWADQIAAEAPQITRENAARYYKEHPALFESRAIYRLHEMTIAADQNGLDKLKAHLVDQGKVTDLAPWMRDQGIAFNDQRVIRAAEQLPIEALPRLSALAPGEHLILESPRGVIIYELIAVQASPIPWEQAQSRIRDYLVKRTGRMSVEREMRRLRRDAKIERFDSSVPSTVATR